MSKSSPWLDDDGAFDYGAWKVDAGATTVEINGHVVSHPILVGHVLTTAATLDMQANAARLSDAAVIAGADPVAPQAAGYFDDVAQAGGDSITLSGTSRYLPDLLSGLV